MMLRPLLPLVSVLVLPFSLTASPPAQVAPGERPGWVYADLTVWDISDEGLPFRFTVAVPGGRDPVADLLRFSDTRWTASLGYAKVYNAFDPTTGEFRHPGGHAALFSVGREFRWEQLSRRTPWAPTVLVEFGLHVATRPFPADGTEANFKLISGLEWRLGRPSRPEGAAWTAALVWPHFSNADLLSPNAGYDGLALRLGRTIRF
jgi:hypothetical protein